MMSVTCLLLPIVVLASSSLSTNAFASPRLLSPSAPSFLFFSSRPRYSRDATRTTSSSSSSTIIHAMPDGGVVITGSAGGVGYAYAAEFMDRGYDVVICDIKDCSAAAAALASRHSSSNGGVSGGRVYHVQCDVSDSDSCERLGQFAASKLGNIGYWINNAGINGGRRSSRWECLSTW